MSNRGRGRGRGYGRGRNGFQDDGQDNSYYFSRNVRGRGFNAKRSNQTSPHTSRSYTETSPQQSDFECEQQSSNVMGKSPPQPIFTPQPQLDLHTQQFLDNLRAMWNLWKKSENVSSMLQDYYSSVENPYESAFKVAVTCPDFYQGRPMSLPIAVIEELAEFLKNREAEFTLCLTQSIKNDVFDTFIKQRNNLFTKLAFDVYKLPVDKHLFLDSVKRLIQNRQYKEACHVSTYLGLTQFHIEDFVIPLLFQDKLTIAEDYLKISPPAQIATAEYLDQLLKGKGNVQVDEIIRRLQIPDIKREKLDYKPLSKLLLRIIKIFNIPPSSCPNLTQRRREGALQFVVRKRYKFNEIEGECWREMVEEAVCGDPTLQEDLIHAINMYGDVAEAAYFAEKYQIPFHKLPYNVAMYIRSGNKVDDRDYSPIQLVPPEQNKPKQVLQLPPDHSVMIVDTDSVFRGCVEVLAQTYVVGIDTEWKPAFSSELEKVSLLQISTNNKTFLIDVIALRTSPVWNDLGIVLFANPDILKLGFGLLADLRKLKETIKLNNVKMSGLGYLDLSSLWKKLMREFNITMPFKGEASDSVEGLSKLVSLCLGLPLDKSEQFSNWDKRPLRESQKSYAALDAYCLIKVYEVLNTECQNQGVPFQDIINDIMMNSSVTKKPKKRNIHRKIPSLPQKPLGPGPNESPIGVKDISVVCDSMVQGMGRQLRTIGIDSILIESTQNHNVCVAISNEQNRVILTKGSVFDRLSTQVPPYMCYQVTKESAHDQVLEFLNFYNVSVTKEDIFSRCQYCNTADFKKLTPDQLQKAIATSRRPVNFYVDDDYDNNDVDYDDYEDSNASSDDMACAPATYTYQAATPEHEAPVCESEQDEDFYGSGCLTNSGAHIKHEAIPSEKFNEVPFFYICDFCGRCYWDGSHLERFCVRLRNIVDK